MTEAGLSIREDAVGNVFGLLAGDGSAGVSASPEMTVDRQLNSAWCWQQRC